MKGGELARRLYDPRIDDIELLAVRPPGVKVDHRDPLGYTHLDRRQTDPVLGIHGLHHVIQETAQSLIHIRNGLGDQFQPGIGGFDELENSHGRGK